MKSLEREHIDQFPGQPKFAQTARFEFFEKKKDRQFGVWVVRQENLHFALPVTTGTKPAIADYLSAPFGLAGFSAPVEEVYPSLVPFMQLSDGKTYAASEGADLIEPSQDGQSLRIIWKKWGRIGSKPGETFSNGLVSEVFWKIEGNKLIRRETLTAEKDIAIKNWRFAFPTTADKCETEINGNQRTDIFSGREGTLKVSAESEGKPKISLQAPGNSRLGKGVLGPIPLHLIFTADDIELKKNQKSLGNYL